MVEREAAAEAARALRAAIEDPALMGAKSTLHIDYGRPRRGEWLETWQGLPGFTRINGGQNYSHACLPGWQYTKDEIRSEMIPDLEKLASTGERPTKTTR